MTSPIAQKQPSLDDMFILKGCMKEGLSTELHSKDFKRTSVHLATLKTLEFSASGQGTIEQFILWRLKLHFFLHDCAFTTGGECVINYQHEIRTSAANIWGRKGREEEQLKLLRDAKPLVNAYRPSSGIPNGGRKGSLCAPHDRAGHNNSWPELLLLSKTKKVLKGRLDRQINASFV